MLNFDFYSPARILFGKDMEKQIGALLKPHASKVLLHSAEAASKRADYMIQ